MQRKYFVSYITKDNITIVSCLEGYKTKKEAKEEVKRLESKREKLNIQKINLV